MFEDIEIEEIPHWTDSEGTVWKIEDMSTSHIKNCLAMFRGHANAILDSDIWTSIAVVSTMNGEMATYYGEQAIDQMIEMPACRYVRTMPAYQTFIMELWRRRNLGLESHLYHCLTT